MTLALKKTVGGEPLGSDFHGIEHLLEARLLEGGARRLPSGERWVPVKPLEIAQPVVPSLSRHLARVARRCYDRVWLPEVRYGITPVIESHGQRLTVGARLPPLTRYGRSILPPESSRECLSWRWF